MRAIGLTHYSDDVDVMAAHEKKGGSPCFTCAYFRRAATNRRAQELGFNKVALAHHMTMQWKPSL